MEPPCRFLSVFVVRSLLHSLEMLVFGNGLRVGGERHMTLFMLCTPTSETLGTKPFWLSGSQPSFDFLKRNLANSWNL